MMSLCLGAAAGGVAGLSSPRDYTAWLLGADEPTVPLGVIPDGAL